MSSFKQKKGTSERKFLIAQSGAASSSPSPHLLGSPSPFHTGWPVVRDRGATLPILVVPQRKDPPTPTRILGAKSLACNVEWTRTIPWHSAGGSSLSRSPIIMVFVLAVEASWSFPQRILLQDVQFSLAFYVALPFWFPYLDCCLLRFFLHYFKWPRPSATPPFAASKLSCGKIKSFPGEIVSRTQNARRRIREIIAETDSKAANIV